MISQEAVQAVLNAIDRTELIDLTANLIRINSVWDPEAGTDEREVADFVAKWATKEGFEVLVEEAAPNRPNVIVTQNWEEGPRRLMFEGHTDVVTPGDPSTWKYDPFGAEIVGNRMYGRGTNDTKGNLAAMLIAMAALKRSGVKLRGSIVGGVLCDEEDQMLGVLDFIDRGHADTITGAIICEPQDGLVCCSQKGAVRVRYKVNGHMSHGAMPLSGLNPVPAVARLITGIESIERKAVERHGKDPLLGWPSFTTTVIRVPDVGPGQINVVPSSSVVAADIRTIPSQDHDEIIRDLHALGETVQRETMDAYKEYDRLLGHDRKELTLTVDVSILTDRPSTLTDRNDPVVKSVHWATESIFKGEPEYAGVPGATDGTFLWSMKGIPIVTIGAGDRQVPHQADEWVDLDQLTDTARIYALSALSYLSGE